jgi:hypothetical protein
METHNLLKDYDEVQSLISRVQSYILNKKSTNEIYSKLRSKLKGLIEYTFSYKKVDVLIEKDFLKLILNTYNLMEKREIESQLHTLELVSLVVGKPIFLFKNKLTPKVEFLLTDSLN